MRREFARALFHRSAVEAGNLLGPTVWIVVPAAVGLAFILFAANGFTWDWLVLLGALLSYPTLFVAAFVYRFVCNVRNPDQNPEWLLQPSRVTDEGFIVAIKSKIGAPHVEAHRCRIRHPSGEVLEAVERRAGSGHTFFFDYPRDFGNATQAVTGRYEIAWSLPGKRGKWTEVLRGTDWISFE